jgi:DnaJ-class molecular chaperone
MRKHRDLYAVLGVSATASPAEVRHGYRTELRRHHPDTREPGTNQERPTQDGALQQILAAYAVLHDPVRRAAYDRRQRTKASIPATVEEGAPVVVLGDTVSTWPGRSGITPRHAGSAAGPRQWLLELFGELGHYGQLPPVELGETARSPERDRR